MLSENDVAERLVFSRANLISWRYGLHPARVEEALYKTNKTLCKEQKHDFCEVLECDPSLTDALNFLVPEFALCIFQKADHNKIRELIDFLNKNFKQYAGSIYSIEEVAVALELGG